MKTQEHPDTLTSLNNLALTKLREAAELHKKELEACIRTLGEEHRFTLLSISNLALVYEKLGKLKRAAELGERVLEARTKSQRSLLF